jgi:large repetitive protein
MRPSHFSAKLAWLVSCFVVITTYSFSQSTKVTIKALTVSSSVSSDGEDNYDYRVNTWYNNILNPNCIDFDDAAKSVLHQVKADDQLRVDNIFLSNVSTPIDFDIETWEDDGCKGGCSYNTDWDCGGADEAHCGRRNAFPNDIQILDLVPGNFVGNNIISTACSGWMIKFHFAYNPVKPTLTKLEYASSGNPFKVYDGSQICPTTSIRISVSNVHKAAHQDFITYTWEYWAGEYVSVTNPEYCSDPTWCSGGGGGGGGGGTGDPVSRIRSIATASGEEPPTDPPCCFEPTRINVPLWRVYTTTTPLVSAGALVIPNVHELPGVAGITSNKSVHFRTLITSNGMTSLYSDPIKITVSPKPPAIGVVNTDPSCSVAATGAVRITGITGMGTYKYILREGNSFEPCNPALGNCNSGVNSDSDISGSSETSLNIPDGSYTLIVANPGSTKGVCASTIYPVVVNAIADNRVTNLAETDISHHGDSEGAISFQTLGGNQAVLSYDLYKSGPETPQAWNSPTINDGTKIFSGLPIGTYNLTVTDGGCSPPVMIKSITLTQPKRVFENDAFAVTNATCTSPADGAIALSVQKTSGVYDTSPPNTSYYHYRIFRSGVSAAVKELITTSPSYSATDLLPGTYVARVIEQGGIDENGYSISFTIADPPPITVPSINTTNLNCFHDNSGAITVSAQGGTGSFVYEMTDASAVSFSSTEGSFSGLHAGPYYLAVKQPGCDDQLNYSSPITLREPTDIKFSISHTDLSCFESGDGSVTIQSINGGTPASSPEAAYNSYIWEKLTNGSWQYEGSSLTAELLSAGAYRFSARDDKNCLKISDVVDVRQPEPLSITSIVAKHIVCYGGKGDFVLTASGGTEPYNPVYSMDGGATYKDIPTTPSLGKGQYMVGIVDQHGCKITDERFQTITAPDTPLDFAFKQSQYNGYNISCNGLNNGNVTLTASGGNGYGFEGYSFTFGGSTFVNSSYFGHITAGTYHIQVKDGRGCLVNKEVVFTEPSALTPVVVDKENVLCFGYTTGSLEVSSSGGVAPYRYQLNANGFQDSKLFTSLGAADYSVTVIDNNGCYTMLSETIESLNPPLAVQHTIDDVSCHNGTDGAITLEVAGGAGGYTFALNNITAPNPITGIGAGIYDVAIRDREGCLAEVNDIIITQPTPLEIDKVILKDIQCFGEHGAIRMATSGGVAPHKFEYELNNSSAFISFNDQSQLYEGNYSVRVVDAHNCITTHREPLTITSPQSGLDYSFVKSDYNGFNISCRGGYNGYITLTASGGNGSHYTGYEYAIDAQSFTAQNFMAGIYAGDHIFSLRDGRGCIVKKTIAFTEAGEEMTGSVNWKKDVTCVEHHNGEVELTTLGGVSPYSYSRDNLNFSPSNVIDSLAVGSYTLYIADANNCRTSLQTEIISLTPEMHLTESITDVSCFNGSDGSVEVFVASGKEPYHYQWNNLQITTQMISNVRAGGYGVTVTDDAGCVKKNTFVVNQPSFPLTASVNTTSACYAKTDGTIAVVADGGTAPYRYSANGGLSYQNASVLNVGTGSYSINVQDSKECITTGVATVSQRNITPEPDFLVATSRNALDTLVLIDISVPRPDSIQWNFDSRAHVISDDQWAPQIQFASEGKYTVNMTGYFGGCDYLLTKTLDVKPYDPSASIEKAAGYRTILSASASPNPTRGPFTLEVQLARPSKITLLVYDVLGTIHYQDTRDRQEQFMEEIDISHAASGIYVLRVIAEVDAREIRLSLGK